MDRRMDACDLRAVRRDTPRRGPPAQISDGLVHTRYGDIEADENTKGIKRQILIKRYTSAFKLTNEGDKYLIMSNLTFGIIKPDAVRAGKQGAIIQRILDAG